MDNKKVAQELLKIAKVLNGAASVTMINALKRSLDNLKKVQNIVKKDPKRYWGALEGRFEEIEKNTRELLKYSVAGTKK